MLEDLLSELTLQDKVANCKMFNIDDFPYPAQVLLVWNLQRSPEDIINTSAVFPGFAEVAELSKTTWTIDKVFHLLVPYLTRQDALPCRLVCHNWVQAVDKFVQHLGLAEPNYAKPESSSAFPEQWSADAFGLRSCWIESNKDVKNYMNKMNEHPSNPFVSRCVQINDRDDERYWTAVTHFLERFGSEIWKLRLGCYRAYPKATLIIRNILALVPNIKLLSLEYNGVDVEHLDEEEFNEIERDLAETPFPSLPHLQYLDYGLCGSFYDAALPQYSQHLVHAKLMDLEFLAVYDSRVHGTFPCLKSLVTKLNHEGELYKLEDLTSPLKTITTNTGERIKLQVYFHVFHHFADTLESFNIEYDEEPAFAFDINGQFEDAPNEIMEFPVLKCIRLENPDPNESLDSLLLVKPGPRALQIQTYIPDWLLHFRDYQLPLFAKMEGESIQIHGYLENMYDSNIWEKIPSLETMQVNIFNPRNEGMDIVYERSGLVTNEKKERKVEAEIEE